MLAVVIATKRVLVLNTEDFLAGKVEELTHKKQPYEVIKEVKNAVSNSQKCVLEYDHEIHPLNRTTLSFLDPKTKIMR